MNGSLDTSMVVGISVACVTIFCFCAVCVAKKFRERHANSCNANDASLTFENLSRGKFTLCKVNSNLISKVVLTNRIFCMLSHESLM